MRIQELFESQLDEITRPPLVQAEYILFKAGYKRLDNNDAAYAQVYAMLRRRLCNKTIQIS